MGIRVAVLTLNRLSIAATVVFKLNVNVSILFLVNFNKIYIGVILNRVIVFTFYWFEDVHDNL